MLAERFVGEAYADVAGLCKVADWAEVAAQGWSLNPGRYVGIGERAADDFEFAARLGELSDELVGLNLQAAELEGTVAQNVAELLIP